MQPQPAGSSSTGGIWSGSDEILGYHLEQACRYRAELGVAADDATAAEARQRLATAGRRAMIRDDVPAAVNLLQRALPLVPADQVEIVLESDVVLLDNDAARSSLGATATTGCR